MGILSDIFRGGPALNRLAKACDESLNCLLRYDLTKEKDEIYRAAWIFTFGVQMSVDKWHWKPLTKIYIPNHPELGRLPLAQAGMLILRNVAERARKIGEEEEIKSIINGENAFVEYAKLVSSAIKTKIHP